MDREAFANVDLSGIETPCFIVDEGCVEHNLQILAGVQKRAGCRILLALKAFAMWNVFPLISQYLRGVCAGSVLEARLGAEEFGGEVHVYAPAYSEHDFREILRYATHIVFNSVGQWEKYQLWFAEVIRPISCGLRVNPREPVAKEVFEHYDPGLPGSGLGCTVESIAGRKLQGISGLHFHALCEQNVEPLRKVLAAFEAKFDEQIRQVKWVNFGGGHHITRDDYDVDGLCELILDFKRRYPNIKTVYLEPGEAVVLNAGVMVTSVLDIVSEDDLKIAVLDMSAEAHNPDVIITRHQAQPYVPEILGAGGAGEYPHEYKLRGISCAAGDVLGTYSFAEPLAVGQILMMLNMVLYTMVKVNTFCGAALPSLMARNSAGEIRLVKKFDCYEEFKRRLS